MICLGLAKNSETAQYSEAGCSAKANPGLKANQSIKCSFIRCFKLPTFCFAMFERIQPLG